jgi:hypothetical protein
MSYLLSNFIRVSLTPGFSRGDCEPRHSEPF